LRLAQSVLGLPLIGDVKYRRHVSVSDTIVEDFERRAGGCLVGDQCGPAGSPRRCVKLGCSTQEIGGSRGCARIDGNRLIPVKCRRFQI
jgi:hypothetical protein